MLVNELFTEELIDEDIRKVIGGAAMGAALFAATQAKAPTTPPLVAQPDEVKVLAQTIWGEARSHGTDGMLAVGHVIVNRAKSGKTRLFGDGVIGVATKDRQFSCWNESDPNRSKMEDMVELDEYIETGMSPNGEPFDVWFAKFSKSKTMIEYKAWKKAKDIAEAILTKKTHDPTNGALFYHTTDVTPYWSKDMKPIGKVNNHIFYRGLNVK